jgi:hypothetical protein
MGEVDLAAAVTEELDGGEEKSEEASGEAAHGKHEREPAEIGVGSLVCDAAEADEDERRSDDSGAEDENAGAEQLASVWLHGHQWMEACMM